MEGVSTRLQEAYLDPHTRAVMLAMGEQILGSYVPNNRVASPGL